MPKGQDFAEQLIGDITGLQIAMQAVAGRLAVLSSERGNDELKQIHQGAQGILASHEVNAPDKDADAIWARAEHMIDEIFGSPNTTMGQGKLPVSSGVPVTDNVRRKPLTSWIRLRRAGADKVELMSTADGPGPTIARIWRGRVRKERADEYEAYNYEVGIKPLIEKAMGVQTFREDRASESEFITISYWESVEVMSRFTGGDPTRIHHLDRDAEFLIELPDQVQILRILKSHGWTGK